MAEGFSEHMAFLHDCIKQLTNEQVSKILKDYAIRCERNIEVLNDEANYWRKHLGLEPFNYVG